MHLKWLMGPQDVKIPWPPTGLIMISSAEPQESS